MVTCPTCEEQFTAEELTRHERDKLVLVHCPSCHSFLGRYRRHGDDPRTDRDPNRE